MRLLKEIEHINYKALKKIVYFILIISFSIYSEQGFGQQTQFSQFYSSPMFLSPSYAGMIQGGRLVTNYRKQWPNIQGAFNTYAVTYDQFFPKIHSGFGVAVFKDEAGMGSLSATDFGALYSFDFGTEGREPIRFRPGIFFKYTQRSVDFLSLTFGDQLVLDGNNLLTTTEPQGQSSVGYIDFTASFLAYTRKYWGGVTVDHLLQPNQSFYQEDATVPMKLSLYGGAMFPLDKRAFRKRGNRDFENITATFLYRTQGGYDQLDLGGYWAKPPFTLGLWFRGIPVISQQDDIYESIDALIILVGYKVGDLKFGYSYDLTISKLIGATGGSHEISLIYEFQPPKSKISKRFVTIPCPSF